MEFYGSIFCDKRLLYLLMENGIGYCFGMINWLYYMKRFILVIVGKENLNNLFVIRYLINIVWIFNGWMWVNVFIVVVVKSDRMKWFL